MKHERIAPELQIAGAPLRLRTHLEAHTNLAAVSSTAIEIAVYPVFILFFFVSSDIPSSMLCTRYQIKNSAAAVDSSFRTRARGRLTLRGMLEDDNIVHRLI